LNGSLHDFATALTDNRNLVEQNQALRGELGKLNTRLDALEAESKQHQFDSSATNNNNTTNY
jgi:regulator of replication initiation timing